MVEFDDEENLIYDLEAVTISAAKVAACEKLTKDERKSIYSNGPGFYDSVFSGMAAIILGFAVSVIICLLLMIFGLIIGIPLVFVSPEDISYWEFAKLIIFEFQWWKIISLTTFYIFIAFLCYLAHEWIKSRFG